MNRKQGFTLVELLVVMAIIAILASIVVPNVQRYIVRARVTRAVAEVSGMELSLTAVMTDAGRGNMSQLFRRDAATERIEWPDQLDDPWLTDPNMSVRLFERAADLYARITYDLLRLGRDCLRNDTITEAEHAIEQDILSKLGTNYMDIALDPWGEVYRVWPGPWRFSTQNTPAGITRWPIPFRVFSVEAGAGAGGSGFAVQTDPFTLRSGRANEPDHVEALRGIIEAPETWPSRVGLPAEASKSVFIWSYGQNNQSSQMLYKAQYSVDNPALPPYEWYYLDEDADFGGGDDINNWDSGNSWQRFYM